MSTRADPPTSIRLPPNTLQPRSATSTTVGSPADLTGGALRSPFGAPGGPLVSAGKMAASTRSGADSPSHELGNGSSRLYSKRAREIQAQEGFSSWGPPTSGNSTPLRETIPESPTDGFPDYQQLPVSSEEVPLQTRRARAGTVPSRFSPGGPTLNGLPPLSNLIPISSALASPYKSSSPGFGIMSQDSNKATNDTLLSRLRAGTMPQAPGARSPFAQSVFSPGWQGRERTSTLASIASIGSDGIDSPNQSQVSREGISSAAPNTLDFLGLAEPSQPPRNPILANVIEAQKQANNRLRSYSVNAKEQYAEEEEETYYTPAQQHELQLLRDMQEMQAHNLHLQRELAHQQQKIALQSQVDHVTRPRARTAGVLESPPRNLLRSYYPAPSRLANSSSTAAESGMSDSAEYDSLPEALQTITFDQFSPDHLVADEHRGPTKSLYLNNVPPSTTITTLVEMFKVYGPVISARVLHHKNCGFVNFESEQTAITVQTMLNNREIFPGHGITRIGYAKPTSAIGSPGHEGLFPSPSPDYVGKDLSQSGLTAGLAPRPATAPLVTPSLEDMRADILDIVRQFGATEEEHVKIQNSLDAAIAFSDYRPEIPAVPEPSQNRAHDAPKLREIRKRIDNNSWAQLDIEAIAVDMLPEIAELASDYLGNTVVQKLFEFCSDDVKDEMLRQISPHMAEIGVHKNGTWAAQKIIDVAKQSQQMKMIVDNLRPYTVPLFLDQFGNYVLQCCLRFGSPFNDFIFETMLTKMWDIAQGRYGARAMRACLESHFSTREQQRMLAAAITLNSVQLATNANGALLLTWFLDTCTFPQRRSVLAPRLVPHLVQLCTHKVAYLTVLKVINQRNEPEARDIILKALFFSTENQVLEDILSDHTCGATLIFKVLTTPFFDEAIRAQVVENIRNVLVRIKAQPAQGYKRLMDEVGLSTRNTTSAPGIDHGLLDRQSHTPQKNYAQQQALNQYYQHMSMPGMDMQRADSVDSNMSAFPSYPMGAPNFGGAQQSYMPPMQYQGMLPRAAPAMNGYYGAGNNFAYGGASSSMDRFGSQNMNGSPIQPAQSQMPGYAPYNMGGFAYNGMNMQMNGGFMQGQEVSNGRRGRQR